MKKVITMILFLLIYTCVLLLAKYYINDLRFSELKILYIGNIMPLILLLGNVTGVLLSAVSKKFQLISTQLILFTIISIIFQVAALLIISAVELPLVYYWNFPVQKIIPAALLIFSLFLHFVIFSQLWIVIFDSKKGNLLQIFFSAGIIIVLLLIITFLFTINSKNSYKLDAEKGAETAVVLGAAVWSKDSPSPLFKARIEKAFELYNNSYFKNIQLTGGKAPGELSEAFVAYNYLKELGVEERFMNYEEVTSTTAEQIKFIALTFERKKPVVIISDAFHLARVLQISEFFNVYSVAAASEYSISWEKLLYFRIRESIALLIFWFFGI